MTYGPLVRRARAASRRALVGTLALVGLVAGMLGVNAYRLADVEGKLTKENHRLEKAQEALTRLIEEQHSLTDAPNGGVRSTTQRVAGVAQELYDFIVWIDPSQRRDTPIESVRNQFSGSMEDDQTSEDRSTGFAAFRRASCPLTTVVTITFEDGSKSEDYMLNLCQAQR